MNREYNVLIVGYGVVGKNLSKEIWQLHPDIYDKYHPEFNSKRDIKYDVAFICVDTPADKYSMLNIQDVCRAVEDNDAEIYVIKSTLPLRCVGSLTHGTYADKRIIYSPEYYGDTQHCNNYDFNFTILGGKREDCIAVQQILQECYDASHQFRLVSSDLAEIAKLMENAWLATKVTFCTQMYEICKANDICYEDLRELFILDPRVNPSHTFVYADHPYWDSHCLNKDVNYLAAWGTWAPNATFLQDMIKFNNQQKERYSDNDEC